MDHSFLRRGMTILTAILLVYAVLVATHKGEFWPFSIYPMFSKAGNPWTRAIVLDVTNETGDSVWRTQTLSTLSFEPISLQPFGIDQIDYSNFISKTQNWTVQRREALQQMFGTGNIDSQRWMAAKVHGKLIGKDSVVVEVRPFLLVTADTVMTNPLLGQSEYFKGD